MFVEDERCDNILDIPEIVIDDKLRSDEFWHEKLTWRISSSSRNVG